MVVGRVVVVCHGSVVTSSVCVQGKHDGTGRVVVVCHGSVVRVLLGMTCSDRDRTSTTHPGGREEWGRLGPRLALGVAPTVKKNPH